jgi:hypothetical protein
LTSNNHKVSEIPLDLGIITLTKQVRQVDDATAPCDSAELRGAGAPEIEITSAMMEAGIDAMYAWYASNDPPEHGVRPIYEAMVRARGCQSGDKA